MKNPPNGHRLHSGAPWQSSNSNGDVWGDIIPDVSTSGTALSPDPKQNYNASGTDDQKRGYAIHTGGTYNAVNYSGKCGAMTAKEFVQIHVGSRTTETEAQALASAMTDLDDMGANEDAALKASLAPSTGFSDWLSDNTITSLSSFETALDAKTPTATTNAASSVTAAGAATLNGSLDSEGLSMTRWFEYGTSSALGSETTESSSQVFSGAVTASLTGLTAGTTYHFRVVMNFFDDLDNADAEDDVEATYYGSILTFTVPLLAQTIDLTSPPDKKVPDGTFNITSTAKRSDTSAANGLLVSYSSSDTSVCTVGASSLSGSASVATVTIVAAGTCTIVASQGGNGSYDPATDVTDNIVITKAAQNIDLTSPPDKNPSDPPFTISSTAKRSDTSAANGLLVSYSSSDTSVCTVGASSLSGSASVATVTIVAAGTCTIVASQGGNGSYDPATDVTDNIDISSLVAATTSAPATTAAPATTSESTTTSTAAVAAATTTTSLPRRITICHRTMAGTFVEITVDRNSLGGHGNHGTDIIPAPPGGCGQRSINRYLATTTTTVSTEPSGRTTQAAPRRITICHWNASNSYVEITVDANGLNGHGDHPNDIIPAPAGGCGQSSVQRVLSSTTTTSVAPGSLQDTQQKLDEERKGGKDKSVLDVVELDSEPKPGGGGSGGGSITLDPKNGGPGVQLLDAKTNDPNVKVEVKSSGSDYNKTDTWVNEGFGSYCWKIESFNGEYSYTLPDPPNPPDSRYAGLAYSAVKVKAGSVVESDPNYQANTVFMNPAPGSVVWPDVNKNGILDPGGQGGGTLGDKAISHIILCVGETQFPQILTTTTTTLPGATTTTFPPATTTTVIGGTTTSAPVRSTTTTTVRGATTTTVRGATTTTVRSTTTTVRASSTTTAGVATTTTVGTTATTTQPSATSTTAPGSTSTTSPGSTSPSTPTTIPGDTQPPIEIEITPTDDFQKQSVVVELVVSTGGQTEVVFLNVNLQRFSVDVPRQITVLPATGVEVAGGSGVATQALLGFGVLLVGMALFALGRPRRRA